MRKKIIVTEETKFTSLFFLSLLLVVLVMALASYLLQLIPTDEKIEDDLDTVVILQAKQEQIRQKKARQTVVSSVREAIIKGKSLTPYLQLSNVAKDSPEYKEIQKMLEDETKRRNAGGVRKESTDSKKIIRYIDESTPRDRTSDAAYIYFVDVAGVLIPRFCVQVALKQQLQMTGLTITADAATISLNVPSYKSENIQKGVAEWYDAPLDQDSYKAVQVMMKARKAVLDITGIKGKVSHNVTEDEIKAFRRVLDGYTALGGRLDYLQGNKPADRK